MHMADSPSNKPAAVVLSIAGSDSSGGAGIQADIKTGAAFGVFVATAITAITAQNSAGVSGIFPLTVAQLEAQIDAVMSGLPVAAIKIGMLANIELAETVARVLETTNLPVVLDPVMGATSGSSLMTEEGVTQYFRERLLPLATLVTPNVAEAARLLETTPATTYDELEQQAKALHQISGRSVLLKGGDAELPLAVDYLVTQDGVKPFSAPRQATSHTHGGGCTTASAIAAGLAQGLTLEQAVAAAKSYIQGAITHSARLQLVPHNGPIHNFYQYW
jgi:hydroxymethylpyrimidine/phosphomethylpyrimidine kinase